MRFHGQGRISVLDFGLIRVCTPSERDIQERTLRAWTAGEADELLAVLGTAGYLPSAGPDLVEAAEAHFASLSPLLGADEERTVRPADAAALVDVYLDERFDHLRQGGTIPGPLVFHHRLNLGLHAVLGALGARANWRRISAESWPWDRSPAPGPLGAAHDRWRRGAADRTDPGAHR
ncbi:MAG: hypothetical protein R2711_06155 [Acidimicrobiales bacterium]